MASERRSGGIRCHVGGRVHSLGRIRTREAMSLGKELSRTTGVAEDQLTYTWAQQHRRHAPAATMVEVQRAKCCDTSAQSGNDDD